MKDTYMQDLAQMLVNEYGFSLRRIVPAKRGFFGETWKIETDTANYFLKIDYWDYHKEIYRKSLSIYEYTAREGIAFVPRIAETKSGRFSCDFMNGVAAVFEYIEGENREDYPIDRLFDRLAEIYALDPRGIVLEADTFGVDILYLFNALSAREELPPLVSHAIHENKELIARLITRLELFSRVCQAQKWDMRITHGDAGGNCILDENHFYVVDWDSVRLAPIERDAWFFMRDSRQIDTINAVLQRRDKAFHLRMEALCYYCYHSFVFYMTEHLQAFLSAKSDAQKQERADAFVAYLDSCWIYEQLKIADAFSVNEVR